MKNARALAYIKKMLYLCRLNVKLCYGSYQNTD